MGRKRLLTILAAVTAAVTLQVGPAAAATDDGCLVLGEDVNLLQLVKLDSLVCVVDSSGKLIQGTIEKVSEPVAKVTEPVTKTVAETTEKVTDAVSGGNSAPTPAPSPTTEPKPTAPKSEGGESDGGSTPAPSRSSSGSNDVAASGDVREPEVRDEARDQQLGALRAIRSDLAAGSPLERGVAGPVQPFGGPMTTDLATPQIADPGEVVPGVDEQVTPQVAPAPAPDQREAVLATSSPMRDIAEAPLALQLLAAALVLGAATVWTIASRELGRGQTTTA